MVFVNRANSIYLCNFSDNELIESHLHIGATYIRYYFPYFVCMHVLFSFEFQVNIYFLVSNINLSTGH